MKRIVSIFVALAVAVSAQADPSYLKEIRGTGLAGLSDAFEVLTRFSIISASKDKIYVAGKDEVAVYVDGRRLSNLSTLHMIPAGTIDKIEIITEPRVEYGGSSNVIVITTLEPQTDEFHLEGRAQVTSSPLWGGSNDLELSGKKGNFLYEGGLALDCSPTKDVEKRFEDAYASQPGSALKWLDSRTVQDFYNICRDVTVDVNGKIEYYIAPEQLLSLRYEYDFLRSGSALDDLHYNVFQRKDGRIDLAHPSESYNAESTSKSDQHRHSLSLGYEGKAGDWKITANLDLYGGKNNGRDRKHEFSGELKKCTFDQTSLYEYGEDYFKAYVSHTLWKGDIHLGLALNDYYQNTYEDDAIADDDLIHARIYCFVPMAFAYLEQSFGQVSLDAGLMYQAALYGYKPFGDDQTAEIIREKTGSTNIMWSRGALHPHLTVSVDAGDAEISAGVSSSTSVPSFSDVSLNVDRLEKGAAYKALPQVESQHSVFFKSSWKWIDVKGLGTHYDKPLFNDIDGSYDFNGPSYWAMDWRLTLSPSVAFWESSLTATVHKQWLSMPVVDAVDDLSAPLGTFQWNNAFEMPWGMRLDIDALLRTKGADRNTFYRKSTWKIDADIQQSFLKGHLTVSLAVDNLFARYCDNIAFYKMEDVSELNYTERISARCFLISMRYKF